MSLSNKKKVKIRYFFEQRNIFRLNFYQNVTYFLPLDRTELKPNLDLHGTELGHVSESNQNRMPI